MDLYDDETLPYVTAMLELPGVVREDISVVVRDGKLLVAGQRRSPLASRLRAINTQDASNTGNTSGATPATSNTDTEHGLNPAKYSYRELKFGKFHRAIEIPPSTDVRLWFSPSRSRPELTIFCADRRCIRRDARRHAPALLATRPCARNGRR